MATAARGKATGRLYARTRREREGRRRGGGRDKTGRVAANERGGLTADVSLE